MSATTGGAGAGTLRERVEWQRAAQSADGQGGFARAWTTAMTLNAEVVPVTGRETLIGGALQGVEMWDVVVRYRPAIGVADRLLWRGRTLNIRSAADPDGRRRVTQIAAESGVASA